MTLDDLRLRATMADVLRENVRVRPDAEALSDGARRLSWRQLYEAARRVYFQFAAYDVHPGDCIGVVLPNQLECAVLYWACALSGIIFVGVSPRSGSVDLELILRHSGARIAFLPENAGGAPFAEWLRAMHLPDLQAIVVVDPNDPAGFFSRDVTGELPGYEPSRADTFAICYTSGTTEAPKGAILSHGNLVWNAATTSEALACSARDAVLLAVAITHIFGLSTGLLVAAIAGARCVLQPIYTAGGALDLCEREGVTVHLGTPTMFVLELSAQQRAPRDLSMLRTGVIGASPVEPDLVDAVRSDLHCEVEIAWGLTEASPVVTLTSPSDPLDERRASVGRPLPGCELALSDVGMEFREVLVRSPGVFAGYYNDAERTAAAITSGGWLRTGDLGYIDDRGYLHLVGRRKEIIIRGGLHVYPGEVESIVGALPWVRAVALVGVPDHVLGERTCACVVVDDADELLPDDLFDAVRAAIEGKLADYKVPDAVLRLAELPRTASGKVLKGELRERAIGHLLRS